MTRFGKLVLIGALSGTLGLIGCSSDGGGSGGGGGAGGEAGLACGAGESIDDSYTTDMGSVSCDALGQVTVPIEVTLGAKADMIDGPTEVDTRIELTLSEETVDMLGGFGVATAQVGEASGVVDEVGGSDDPINVRATAPCTVDFSDDPNNNGMPGPIAVTTPATLGMWTAVDGSIVVEVVDITFDITSPVPIMLSTAGTEPDCVWDEQPTVTLEAM